jgi:hypothetical protein
MHCQWLNVALQDLPVLTQMALNIANLTTLLAPDSKRVLPMWL